MVTRQRGQGAVRPASEAFGRGLGCHRKLLGMGTYTNLLGWLSSARGPSTWPIPNPLLRTLWAFPRKFHHFFLEQGSEDTHIIMITLNHVTIEMVTLIVTS